MGDHEAGTVSLEWDEKATLHKKRKVQPFLKPIEVRIVAAIQLSARQGSDQGLDISIDKIGCRIGEFDDQNLPVIAAMDVLITTEQNCRLRVQNLTESVVILSSNVKARRSFQKISVEEATAQADLTGCTSIGPEVGVKLSHSRQRSRVLNEKISRQSERDITAYPAICNSGEAVREGPEQGARLPLQVLRKGLGIGVRNSREFLGAYINISTSANAALLTEQVQSLRVLTFPGEGSQRNILVACRRVQAGACALTTQVSICPVIRLTLRFLTVSVLLCSSANLGNSTADWRHSSKPVKLTSETLTRESIPV